MAAVSDARRPAAARWVSESECAGTPHDRWKTGPVWYLGHRAQQAMSSRRVRRHVRWPGILRYRLGDPWIAISTMGGRSNPETDRRQWPGGPDQSLPAGRNCEGSHDSTISQDHPDTGS